MGQVIPGILPGGARGREASPGGAEQPIFAIPIRRPSTHGLTPVARLINLALRICRSRHHDSQAGTKLRR